MSALSGTNRAIALTTDTFNVFYSVEVINKRREMGQDISVETVDVANKLTLLGFGLVEFGLLLANAQTRTLEYLKYFETIPRVLNIPIQYAVAARHNNGSFIANIAAFERGVVAPILGYLRVSAERDFYSEKNSLETGLDNDGQKITDPTECKKNMETSAKLASTAVKIKLGADCCSGTIGLGLSGLVFQELAAYFQPPIPQQTLPVPQQNSTAQDPFDENDEISLLALDRIPQPLHGDPVFSAYSCAIGLMPIRFVVGDPTTNPPVIYEKSVILNWLARNPINPTSPISRRPLQPDQLLPRPGIQALIDSRLALYSKGLNEYLSTNVNTPVDETIIAQARQEQPNIQIAE